MSERAKFFADTPFVKEVGQSGDLTLKGYASTWSLDRDHEYVERDAFDGSIEKYFQNPILLWQHDLEKPIGVVQSMSLDENGLDVECYVPKPDDKEPDWSHLAYNKVKSGIVKTFSIGGFFEKMQKGAKRAITHVDLFEVSVVSVPSNPDSIFAAAVKSIEGSARPELTVAVTSQMQQILGMKPVTDPEIATMTLDEKQERYEFLASIYRKTGKLPPRFDSWEEIVAAGKPVMERTSDVLHAVRLVEGKVDYEHPIKQVSLTDADASDVQDAVVGLESALEDLEGVLKRVTGLDFDQSENEEGDEGQMADMMEGRSALQFAVKAAHALVEEVKELHDTKRGRVLSSANERKLRNMRQEIDAILSQLESDAKKDKGDDSEEDDAAKGDSAKDGKQATEVETLEDDLELAANERLADDGIIERSDDGGKSWVPVRDTKSKPTNLRKGGADDDGDGTPDQCSTCTHWRAPEGDTGAGFCKKFKFPTRANQLSDGYAAKSE